MMIYIVWDAWSLIKLFHDRSKYNTWKNSVRRKLSLRTFAKYRMICCKICNIACVKTMIAELILNDIGNMAWVLLRFNHRLLLNRQQNGHSVQKHWINSLSPGGCGCDFQLLTHWGRATHICISKLTIIGSDNGLAPTIVWTNSRILLIRTLVNKKVSETLSEIHIFSFKKIHLKMSSGKWRPFWFGLNLLIFKCIVVIPFGSISNAIVFRWMAQDLPDDSKSDGTKPYLKQC